MGFFDKVKNALTMSEEEYLEDVDMEDEDEYEAPRQHSSHHAKQYDSSSSSNVGSVSGEISAIESISEGNFTIKLSLVNSVSKFSASLLFSGTISKCPIAIN